MIYLAPTFDEKELVLYCGYMMIISVGGSRKTICGRTIPFPRGQLFQKGFLAPGSTYLQRLLTLM
jgi:hypothetical protein